LVNDCILENDTLTSKEFESNQSQKYLEVLQTLSEPKSIETILDSIAGASEEKVLSLIKEHNLGRIHQGKLFLPTAYLEGQENLIKNLIENPGYVSV
jgi:hypothetical protein